MIFKDLSTLERPSVTQDILASPVSSEDPAMGKCRRALPGFKMLRSDVWGSAGCGRARSETVN